MEQRDVANSRSRGIAVALTAVAVVSVAPAQSVDDQAIAIVNGRPITRSAVVDLLMRSHGLAAMQQLIMLDLAKQEAARRGLEVTRADVEREHRSSLAKLTAEMGDGQTLSDSEKRQALAQVLEKRGLSMAEFEITMERNAHLRKIAQEGMVIDEKLIREQFARTYGEKVVVRHIQLANMREVNEAQRALESGESFESVATRLSRNPQTAPEGGRLGAFTADETNIPAAIRDAAFSMREGEVSAALRVDNAYHILKLERRIPPEGVRFEDVRNRVERELRDRVATAEMNRIATELFRKARVRVLDDRVRPQFEKLVRELEAGSP